MDLVEVLLNGVAIDGPAAVALGGDGEADRELGGELLGLDDASREGAGPRMGFDDGELFIAEVADEGGNFGGAWGRGAQLGRGWLGFLYGGGR